MISIETGFILGNSPVLVLGGGEAFKIPPQNLEQVCHSMFQVGLEHHDISLGRDDRDAQDDSLYEYIKGVPHPLARRIRANIHPRCHRLAQKKDFFFIFICFLSSLVRGPLIDPVIATLNFLSPSHWNRTRASTHDNGCRRRTRRMLPA
jgi:hypothetical protein